MLHAQFIINVQECHVAFSENRDTVRTRGERRTKRENVKNRSKTVQQFFKLRAVCALISGKWKGQERERERQTDRQRGTRRRTRAGAREAILCKIYFAANNRCHLTASEAIICPFAGTSRSTCFGKRDYFDASELTAFSST